MLRWFAVFAGLALIGCSQSNWTPLDEARTSFDEERYWDTIAACDQVLKNDEENAEGFLLRGRAHMGLELPDRAVEDFSALIRIKPEDAEGYQFRADAYRKLEEVELAFTDRQRARELSVILKSARPFADPTTPPLEFTRRPRSATEEQEQQDPASGADEEQQAFPGYGAEVVDDGFDQSQELEAFAPAAPFTGRQESHRGAPSSTPFRSPLPDPRPHLPGLAAEAREEGQQDPFRQWITQRTPLTPIVPPPDVPLADLPAPDVPLEEPVPSAAPRPQITTALPIDLDGRPLVQRTPIGPPHVSLPITTGLNTVPAGAVSARSGASLRNLRHPTNASLKPGSFHANPVHIPTRPTGNGSLGPARGAGKPLISTAIDTNRVATPSTGVTTGIQSQSSPVDPEQN